MDKKFMDKKTMAILGGIMGGFLLLIIILFILSSCAKKEHVDEKYTYEQLEEKMREVAYTHFANADTLPKENNDSIELPLDQILKEANLGSISKIIGEDVTCEGKVTVKNNGGQYLYTPYLSCSDNEDGYVTTKLSDAIIENSLVTTGVGLHKVNNQYIMKGEVTNNYVTFGARVYRIMRINEDGSIRLFEQNAVISSVWDDRYNSTYKSNTGINSYVQNNVSSRLKESLDTYYNSSDYTSDELKAYIIEQPICLGNKNLSSKVNDGSEECSVTLDKQRYTLLNIYEFVQASLDPACVSADSPECYNYNWITKNSLSTWTTNLNEAYSNAAYYYSHSFRLVNCNKSGEIRATFNIDPNVVYESGDGTKENPYIISEKQVLVYGEEAQ